MNQEELQVAAFEIILHSGTARTEIHEAFADMREGRFDEAEAKLDHSNEEILEAHHIMVHAQDHLMTTMTLLEVAKEMLVLHRKVG